MAGCARRFRIRKLLPFVVMTTAVLGEPIEQRGRELLVAAEHLGPLGERQIRRDGTLRRS